jgi:hypothetical protein
MQFDNAPFTASAGSLSEPTPMQRQFRMIRLSQIRALSRVTITSPTVIDDGMPRHGWIFFYLYGGQV